MFCIIIITVRSRNLLAIKEPGALDDPHPIGLGGEYPEWDGQVDVMATWRLEQQRKQEQADLHETEPHPHLIKTNETQKAFLVDLHAHR